MDTYGSRSLAVGGAGHRAGRPRRWSEGPADRRAPAGGQSATTWSSSTAAFRVKGDPEKAKTIQAVAWEAFTAHNLPDGMEPTLFGASTVDPTDFSFPHGTHLCAMEVDTETGKVTHPQVRRASTTSGCRSTR